MSIKTETFCSEIQTKYIIMYQKKKKIMTVRK